MKRNILQDIAFIIAMLAITAIVAVSIMWWVITGVLMVMEILK